MTFRGLACLLVCLATLLSQSSVRVRAVPAESACCLEDCCCQEVAADSCCTTDEDAPAATRLVDACGCGSSEHDGVTHAVVHTVFLELARIEGLVPRESDRTMPVQASFRGLGRARPEPPVPRACVPGRRVGAPTSLA